MNIFVLDTDASLAATYHCDKHVVKMITEHNQMLGSVNHTARGARTKKDIDREFIDTHFQDFPRLDEKGFLKPYGIGYKNHPCTVWTGKSLENYKWLCDLTIALCKEYTLRYGKVHAGEIIVNWYSSNVPVFDRVEKTPFALAMPEHLKSADAVDSYRSYYASHKAKFAKWKIKEPWWWSKHLEKLA